MEKLNEIIIKDIDLDNRRFVRLCPIGDCHIGSPDFNREFFEFIMSWIYKNPNVVVIGMGDYIDLATLTSPTTPFTQQTSGTQQAKELMKYFKPLADEGRLIGLLLGNHEYRLNKHAGVDIVDLACDMLDVPYLGVGEFVQLNTHRNGNTEKYIIYATHGSSAASTPGGKLNAQYRQSFSVGAELYLSGHTHHLSAHKENRYIVENGKRKLVTMYFVNTGHFTSWWGSYAQMRGYPIGNFGSPKIKLHGTKHRISVNI